MSFIILNACKIGSLYMHLWFSTEATATATTTTTTAAAATTTTTSTTTTTTTTTKDGFCPPCLISCGNLKSLSLRPMSGQTQGRSLCMRTRRYRTAAV